MNGSPNCPDCGVPLLRSYPECPNCGLSLEAIDEAQSAPQFPLPPEQARSTARSVSAYSFTPAGHGRRIIAAVLDGLLVGFTLTFVGGVMVAILDDSRSQQSNDALNFIVGLFVLFGYLAANLLYPVLMEASSWQATVGKRVAGLRVANSMGERISIGKAIGRNMIKGLVSTIFPPLILVVLFTRHHQGLHDLAAQTFVLDGRAGD